MFIEEKGQINLFDDKKTTEKVNLFLEGGVKSDEMSKVVTDEGRKEQNLS